MMIVRLKADIVLEPRSRSRWEFESSSEVKIFDGSSMGTNRKVQKLAIEARQNSPRRSSQSPGACWESAGALSRVRRMFTESTPEACRKKRLMHRNTNYSNHILIIIIRVYIKLGSGGNPTN